MSEKFEFETGRVTDLKRPAQLLSQEYPGQEVSDMRFLDWEYLKNPFGNGLVTLVSDESGIPAAQYAVIPIEVIVKGEIIPASVSLNTITLEKFRGRGLFVKSAEETYARCKHDGILFTMGIPNANSFSGFIKRLQFTHVSNLLFLIKPLRPIKMFKLFFDRGEKKKGEENIFRINTTELLRKSITEFNCETDSELYEDFWKSWQSNDSIFTNRTLSYIRWRYFENPLRKYTALKLTEQGAIKSFIAIRTMYVFGRKACIIMDHLSIDKASDTKMIDALISVARENECDFIISASANKKKGHKNFMKPGFYLVPKFLLPQQLPFIVRIHKQFKNSNLLLDAANWHFGFGDYDIF